MPQKQKERQAKIEYLLEKFITMVKHTSDMKTKCLITEAMKKPQVRLSKAYMAKRRAPNRIWGTKGAMHKN